MLWCELKMNQSYHFIEVYVRCGPYKLLVYCKPYKFFETAINLVYLTFQVIQCILTLILNKPIRPLYRSLCVLLT